MSDGDKLLNFASEVKFAVGYDDSDDDFGDDEEEDDPESSFARLRSHDSFEARAAERLSVRLLAVPDDDSEEEDRILRESLQLGPSQPPVITSPTPPPFSAATSMRQSQSMMTLRNSTSLVSLSTRRSLSGGKLDGLLFLEQAQPQKKAERGICFMVTVAVSVLILVIAASVIGVKFVGPPSQPVGPYTLIERQEGHEFFDFYTFYEGRDSVGSNGFNTYVSMQSAKDLGIVNVTQESDELDVYATRQRRLQHLTTSTKTEPFIYMGSSPTPDGPRNSIRLEGNRRFNRGLFIIDLRHMPAGCGVWPAFWLTDEANWPVNGEIDIVEGVNYQSEAKTALHSTNGCTMADIPLGTMTGAWDTAQGIPDAKTGIPDMTLRYARNCFVYDPHQWLNQGCVAVDVEGGTLGQPLNAKGGGVFALEWDPINRHIRSWVFTPHAKVPDNLVDAIRTASNGIEDRIMPDPNLWPIPYGYYAIGEGTDCPASHFRQMRLVFNTAFCGSVSGNRFQLDCPEQAQSFDTCNEYVKSEPEELNEAYWKIRGVYVYEREWERTWLT